MIRALALAAILGASAAVAEPLRLRGDALAAAQAPAGLLVLEADGARPGLGAEAVVWMGQGRDDSEHIGDALIVVVQVSGLRQRAHLRLGRLVATAGALRPVHLDGLAGRVRLPYRLDVETFAGVPVRRDGARAWDWIAGGRLARRLGDLGSTGVALLERREQGRLAGRELGFDAGSALGERSEIAARLAIDLLVLGVAEARLAASRRVGSLRAELSVAQRSPSHLVPATSLFSVLGDIPSQQLGLALGWRAAPRLDLLADVGGRRIDEELAPELTGRAQLRLDDRGRSVIAGELRRSGLSGAGWLGARGSARIALPAELTVAVEVELVRPDADRAGALWPWSVVALSTRRGAWEAAVAVEASASPEHRHRVDALAQLARRWEAR